MRNTIILIMIAIALGAYVWFYEVEGGKEREKQKKRMEKILVFEKDSIRTIDIFGPAGKFRFEKVNDLWNITQPLQTMAEKSHMDILLSALHTAVKNRSFSSAKKEAAQYGLGAAALNIQLTDINDQSLSLKLGDKNKLSSFVYASVGDTAVHLIADHIKTKAQKSLFEWRDKKIVHFERNSIQKIELSNPQLTIEFHKKAGNWNIVSPVKAKADQNAVNALLNALQNNNIKSVVSEKPNLRLNGLSNPAFLVRLFGGKDSAVHSVIFSKFDGNEVKGKDEARKHIFQIDTAALSALNKKQYDFRDKTIIDFNPDEIDRLNLSKNSELMRFYKDTTDSWKNAEGVEAKNDKISELLRNINNLRAASFENENSQYLNSYGLASPAARIELFAKDHKLAELNFGNTKKKRIYIRDIVNRKVMTVSLEDYNELFPEQSEFVTAEPQMETEE
jgi:hypothetical protein